MFAGSIVFKWPMAVAHTHSVYFSIAAAALYEMRATESAEAQDLSALSLLAI